MKKWTAWLVAVLMLFTMLPLPVSAAADALKQQDGLNFAKGTQPNGEYVVMIKAGSEWKEVDKLRFGKDPQQRTVDLGSLIAGNEKAVIKIAKRGDGVKEFKVSVPEAKWGITGFTYTDKVKCQHKVYEFKIPLEDAGMDTLQPGDKLELAFAAYGTMALGELKFEPKSSRCKALFHKYQPYIGWYIKRLSVLLLRDCTIYIVFIEFFNFFKIISYA